MLDRPAPCFEGNYGNARLHRRAVVASAGEAWLCACRPDSVRPHRLVKVLEKAIAEILAHRIDPVRKRIARSGIADCLTWACQICQRGRQLFMHRCAGDRLVRAGQRCQPCCQIYRRSVDIGPVAPGHCSVDPCAKVQLLVFRDVGILHGDGPMHLGGSVDSVGHRLETRHQAVAQGLDEDAAMTGQYLGGGDTDEVCPSANGVGFVLPHEPHRLHEVDQKHDGLLLHKPHACATHIGSLGPGGLFSRFLHLVIGHVDLAP